MKRALIVNATAGSGKTTTIVDGLTFAKCGKEPAKYKASDEQKQIWEWMKTWIAKDDDVIVCAFSKAIAEELTERLQFGKASTIHSLGMRIMRENNVRTGKLDTWKTANLYLQWCEVESMKDLSKAQRAILDDVKELVKVCKDNVLTEDDIDEHKIACLAMDNEYTFSSSASACTEAIRYVLTEGSKLPVTGQKKHTAFSKAAPTKGMVIDYDDMIYLPARYDLKISVDCLIVDECLPGWTPVMLGSGGSKPIQEIKIGDVVRSYDTSTGRAKNCKVTATQKIHNRKPLVKVKVKHNHKTEGRHKFNFVVCTVDHKIWTVNKGWVYAGDIMAGDTVLIETAAETTQTGILQDLCPDGKSCPMPATVESIEATYITENYVYDITVEGCHNFYGNGVLVHNCQDLSAGKLKLISNQDCNTYICIGDPFQAIFAFAGSMTNSFDNIAKAFDEVEVLPLTYTYRCGKAIVAEAQKIVGDVIRAGETNCDGEICHIDEADMVLTEGDMLVSRVNAPLMKIAWGLVKARKPVQVVGRNIGSGLTKLINKLTDKKEVDAITLCQLVEDWREHQVKLLQTKKYDTEARQIAIGDQADCIVSIAEECGSSLDVLSFIETIFNDAERSSIKLSSIHRAKGLEADNVFFYNPKNVPHCMAKTEEAIKQEWNLKFVATTRAIKKLTYVRVPEKKIEV